jgi:hypothetical protein
MEPEETTEQPDEGYDAPAVEDLDASEGASVTAAGGSGPG